MGDAHYYYALDRKAAERVFDLTWNQFLEAFGWGKTQWEDIGEYLAFSVEPEPDDVAPILPQTIRETIPRMSPQYFCMIELSYQLGRRSFVKLELDAHNLEDDCVALISCGIRAFLNGDIDDRTLWCLMTIHKEWASGVLSPGVHELSKGERRRIKAARKRYGRGRPVFDWQTQEAVRDGHTALSEEDTRRFARFVQLAWRKNWPVYSDVGPLLRFRDFKLAKKLHVAAPKLRGNCLVRYYGPDS
jgi:hypothetical protein